MEKNVCDKRVAKQTELREHPDISNNLFLQKYQDTHQHTPWFHLRRSGLEDSWHNIVRCVNTSPPYILCKNCD